MLKASFKKHTFHFKQPGGTSRGVLTSKDSWYIVLSDSDNPEKTGIGECSIIRGLSIDDRTDFEEKLKNIIRDIHGLNSIHHIDLNEFPSIRFGLETAFRDLEMGGNRILFPSTFVNGQQGIPINGLIWMGEYDFMQEQIIQKIESGFRCLKLKIGAINFSDEIDLLRMIRKNFSDRELELRVDANGAFSPEEALEKLKILSAYRLHSIEQPIRQGQWKEMAELCAETPLPIALDEELIGFRDDQIADMLDTIKPQFIILKPSLLGGWKRSELVISEVEKRGIGWWVTSALEGNVGLNAISQWTATLNNDMPQGLGTGQLFSNNIPSPLYIENAELYFDKNKQWDLNQIFDEK
jgi:o-succinylbenzoate synthase